MSKDCCGIARALRQRIDELEECLERAETALKHRDGQLVPPNDWALTRQEAVLARVFALRDAGKTALLAAMEQDLPTRDGRAPNHCSVILGRLRAKLADFGWVIIYTKTHCGLYGVLPDQKAAFRAAMDGTGDISHPAMAKPRLRRRA
tara:strand:- start:8765 stop:9208 length:444 start_codon:yes stop_codon:yes gene_type:complete